VLKTILETWKLKPFSQCQKIIAKDFSTHSEPVLSSTHFRIWVCYLKQLTFVRWNESSLIDSSFCPPRFGLCCLSKVVLMRLINSAIAWWIQDESKKKGRKSKKISTGNKSYKFVLWWRSGFDLSLVIRDPEIKSRSRNALQGRRRDHSSQEASLILK